MKALLMYDLLSISWSPDSILDLGLFHLRWYSVCFGLAVLSGAYLLRWFFIREEAPQSEMIPLFAVLLGSGLIGARLAHCFFYDWSYFSKHPLEIIAFWNGGFRGLASHGGGAGMLIGLWAFSRLRQKIHFWWYADRLAIAFPLGGIFIRFGNLMNSEIPGIPTSLPWAFVFSINDQLPRHPVQVYEILMLLLILAFMLYQYNQKLSKIPLGRFAAWFFLWVPACRFFIDYFKADEYWIAGLKTGQVLHIPFFLMGCLLWVGSQRRWFD